MWETHASLWPHSVRYAILCSTPTCTVEYAHTVNHVARQLKHVAFPILSVGKVLCNCSLLCYDLKRLGSTADPP